MKIEDFKIGAQRYVCVDQYEHEIHRYVDLFVLRSRCVDCGGTFECRATKTAIKRRQVTHRCKDCRAPGIPVTPRKGPTNPHRAKAPSARKAQCRRAQARLTARRAAVAVARAPQRPAEQLAVSAAPELQAAPTASAAAFEADLDSYKAALGLLDG